MYQCIRTSQVGRLDNWKNYYHPNTFPSDIHDFRNDFGEFFHYPLSPFFCNANISTFGRQCSMDFWTFQASEEAWAKWSRKHREFGPKSCSRPNDIAPLWRSRYLYLYPNHEWQLPRNLKHPFCTTACFNGDASKSWHEKHLFNPILWIKLLVWSSRYTSPGGTSPSISSGYFPGGTSYKRSPARVATVSGRLETVSKKFSKPRETGNAGIPGNLV